MYMNYRMFNTVLSSTLISQERETLAVLVPKLRRDSCFVESSILVSFTVYLSYVKLTEALALLSGPMST